MDCIVDTLKLFDIGSWEEATQAGNDPTTTKWVDRTKKDEEGHEFMRCRDLVRGVKARREGPRDDFHAAALPLEAKQACCAHVSPGPAEPEETEERTR